MNNVDDTAYKIFDEVKEKFEHNVAMVLAQRLGADEIHDEILWSSMSNHNKKKGVSSVDSDFPSLALEFQETWEECLNAGSRTKNELAALGFPERLLELPAVQSDSLFNKIFQDTESYGKQLLNWDRIVGLVLKSLKMISRSPNNEYLNIWDNE
jgi:hypothetical protein